MSTLVNRRTKSPQSFVPTTALAGSIEFDSEMMHVFLTDGRVISLPISWFPALKKAAPEQRLKYEIGAGGIGLHWPELDEELSVAGLMAGVDSQLI